MALGMSHGALMVPYSAWIQLALTLPVIFYSGGPIYAAAWSALRHRLGQHELADRAGNGRGVSDSLEQTVRGRQDVYYEAAAAIIALVLLGRALEGRARGKASLAIRGLIKLQPPTARVLRDGAEMEITDGRRPRGRCGSGAAGRADAGGWDAARRRIGRGRIHAHGREPAGGQARGGRGVRGDDEPARAGSASKRPRLGAARYCSR